MSAAGSFGMDGPVTLADTGPTATIRFVEIPVDAASKATANEDSLLDTSEVYSRVAMTVAETGNIAGAVVVAKEVSVEVVMVVAVTVVVGVPGVVAVVVVVIIVVVI